MPNRITVNLITLNEAHNLPRCLGSVAWADEIVVVDGRSRDGTVDVARRFTPHVVEHPFDDFASQRNRAIEQSTGDWILSIDADERIPTALAREMVRATRDAPDSVSGFWTPLRSRIFGRRFRFSGTSHERKMRLFRRDRGRWQGELHETVNLRGRTESLRCAIDHESTPDVATYLRKMQRYSDLAAQRLLAAGRSPCRVRQILSPLASFARIYFGKLGMFDGPEGLRFSVLSGVESWVTYRKLARLREAQQTKYEAAWFDSPLKEEWHDTAIAFARARRSDIDRTQPAPG
jgi:glycosyltransferase involved in cell wall biosynthesis